VVLLVCLRRPLIWPQAFASFFYFNNYYQAIFGNPNTGFSHTWSLAVEEQFYLLWPVLFFLWKDNLRRLIVATISIVIAVWAYRAVLQFGLHVPQGYLYEAFDTRADHLLMGCLLALILGTTKEAKRAF
jgi:peptidoglycan/LPS O-acetylase OafA/YrhL